MPSNHIQVNSNIDSFRDFTSTHPDLNLHKSSSNLYHNLQGTTATPSTARCAASTSRTRSTSLRTRRASSTAAGSNLTTKEDTLFRPHPVRCTPATDTECTTASLNATLLGTTTGSCDTTWKIYSSPARRRSMSGCTR